MRFILMNLRRWNCVRGLWQVVTVTRREVELPKEEAYKKVEQRWERGIFFLLFEII
jgi:hypothetical protein